MFVVDFCYFYISVVFLYFNHENRCYGIFGAVKLFTMILNIIFVVNR